MRQILSVTKTSTLTEVVSLTNHQHRSMTAQLPASADFCHSIAQKNMFMINLKRSASAWNNLVQPITTGTLTVACASVTTTRTAVLISIGTPLSADADVIQSQKLALTLTRALTELLSNNCQSGTVTHATANALSHLSTIARAGLLVSHP